MLKQKTAKKLKINNTSKTESVNKTCFHIWLEEQKNEAASLFPTFLAQRITRDNYIMLLYYNAI